MQKANRSWEEGYKYANIIGLSIIKNFEAFSKKVEQRVIEGKEKVNEYK